MQNAAPGKELFHAFWTFTTWVYTGTKSYFAPAISLQATGNNSKILNENSENTWIYMLYRLWNQMKVWIRMQHVNSHSTWTDHDHVTSAPLIPRRLTRRMGHLWCNQNQMVYLKPNKHKEPYSLLKSDLLLNHGASHCCSCIRPNQQFLSPGVVHSWQSWIICLTEVIFPEYQCGFRYRASPKSRYCIWGWFI